MFFKNIIWFMMFLSSFAFATPNVVDSLEFIEGQNRIQLNFDDPIDDTYNKHWIAIYTKSLSNEWSNVLDWSWQRDLESIDEHHRVFDFKNLPSGIYEARAFLDNSFDTHKSVEFEIVASGNDKIMFPSSQIYDNQGLPTIVYQNAPANESDWVGVFKKGVALNIDNLIAWRYIRDSQSPDPKTSGELTLHMIQEGALVNGEDYSLIYFLNDSYEIYGQVGELSIVEGGEDPFLKFINYQSNLHKYVVYFYNYRDIHHDKDWIAIFNNSDEPTRNNILFWSYVGEDKYSIEIPSQDIDDLSNGLYKVVLFADDTYHILGSCNFEKEDSLPYGVVLLDNEVRRATKIPFYKVPEPDNGEYKFKWTTKFIDLLNNDGYALNGYGGHAGPMINYPYGAYITILDVTNMNNPILKSQLNLDEKRYPIAMYTESTCLYIVVERRPYSQIAVSTELRIVSTDDSENPYIVARHFLFGGPSSSLKISKNGNLLYIKDKNHDLTIDVTDPSNPE